MNRRKAYISMQLAIALLLPIVLLFPASAYAATTAYICSSGDWSTPGCWSGGAVPGPEDTAVIGGTNVTISATPPNPGSVEIGPATRIDVDAGQSLTVENSMTLTTTCQSCGGIQFFGPGSIGFAPGATLSITLGPADTPGLWGQLQLHEGMTFTLGAATTWTSGNIILEGAFGTTKLVVPAGATFPLLDRASIVGSTTSDRVVNEGTIVKSGPDTMFFDTNLFNSGTLDVEQGTLTAHAGAFPLVQDAGRIVVRGSVACTVPPDPTNAGETFLVANVTLNGGTLEGDGSVTHVTSNGGTVDPGAAGERGKLCLRGNYTQAANGTLRVDINGAALGSGGPEGYDRLAVGGVANLAGTLAIVNDPSFAPQEGDVFTILTRAGGSGTFDTVTGAVTSSGTYQESYTPTQVNLSLIPEPPSVTINQSAGQADPTSSSPILFDVLFSEPVTGFVGDDVSFAGSTVGGTLAASVSGSGANYTVSVTGMSGSGTVVASIPAGAAVDAGGNPSLASTSTDNTVTFDEAPPPGPSCEGVAATIYVGDDGRIVGGPDNGKLYRGRLVGTGGDDVMVGTNGADLIVARAGADRICGGEGNDQLKSGGGPDALFGEGGNDVLAAAGGNDTLTGGLGADQFIGGAGTDTATDFNLAEGDTKSGVEA